MFRPLTAIVNGTYFADEAAFADSFRPFSPFPAPKRPGYPRKTWVAHAASAYHINNGSERPGFLTLAEGQSFSVIDKSGQIDHIGYSTPTIPFEQAVYLSQQQHSFYVAYRFHPDFSNGIPALKVADYPSLEQAWLSDMNFSTNESRSYLPPLSWQGNMGLRFKPGSTTKLLADVEVFFIEDYQRANRPPVAGPSTAVEYAIADDQLPAAIIPILFGAGDNMAKGAAIRAVATKRK